MEMFDTIAAESTSAGGLETQLSFVTITLISFGACLCCAGCFCCACCCCCCFFGSPILKYAKRDERETRLRKSKSLLEEALKHGYVNCRKVVCLLVGVAGVGKTHMKHMLFGWAPPESRDSTPLAAKPVQAIRVRASAQNGQLQEVDFDQLDEILACTVATGVSLEKRTFICCNRMKMQTKSPGIRSSSHSLIFENPSSEPTSHRKRCCFCCTGPDSELQQTTKAALDKTAHQIANTSEPQQLLDCDWIYLIDSGGQIEFLEVLPAFLQHTSVCLFVTNLSEELSDRPKINYFEDGNPVGDPTLCPFTNEEMLLRCVQTIQTQCTHQRGNTNQGSKLVMVGTHRDFEDQCSESRQEKNLKLRNILHSAFNQILVFHDHQMKELIFPINAKTPGPPDYKVANQLTDKIWSAVSGLEPRKTPISWFKFEQHIQKLAAGQKRVLHRSECSEMAESFHLSKKDLDAALDHLAGFGVIHYYPLLLPDVVFIDPQLLLDKISELVKFHYQLRHADDERTHTPTGGEWRRFRNEGCITLELLKQFPEHYTDFFTAAEFLRLMKDRLIATHLIDEHEYFMPCLLQTMKSEEIDQYRVTPSECDVAPVTFYFSCKLVPHGVFCSLVAFLQSSQNSSPWRLHPCPEDPSEPLCLTRNCIKFQLPEGAPGSLTLIDAFSHFEVHLNAPYDVCARLCLSIQQTIFIGILKAAWTLGYHQLHPKLAFLCKHGDTRPHLALPADALDYWKCELQPDTVYGRLMDEHMVWRPDKGAPKENSNSWSRIKTAICQKLKRASTREAWSWSNVRAALCPIFRSNQVHAWQATEEDCSHLGVQVPKAFEVQPPLEAFSEVHGEAQAPNELMHLPSVGTQSSAPTTEMMVVDMETPLEGNEACPTVLECIKFKGRQKIISIPQEIGTNYSQFGIFLLNDSNGTRVHNIELEYRGDVERINTEILREWATGRGKKPVSWGTLTTVLRDIELCTLASEIEEVKLMPATPL